MDDLESLGTIEVDAGICNDCLACIDACPERAPRRKHLSGAAAYLESSLPAFRRFATGQPEDGAVQRGAADAGTAAAMGGIA